MALTTNTSKMETSVHNMTTGKVVSDAGAAAAATFSLGFVPRYVKFVNLTDRTIDEWFDGMAAASSLHTVAAGTVTLETAHGITVNAPSAVDGSGNSFTVDSTTMVASKTFYWVAFG